ncbi:NAD(P)H-dependent oxidoreductase [Flagellimonas aequoris]|uniref:NAD(P)H-dependent oxidoreductase n=1 Tax=Flagellimonas aequoris TaxID=2306997 RepID=A0A418N2H2_9FLAO|nr:NAD(P)H-dependent oxidoreductase [Allomuricauda aequoris]RIV67525.1 NAD(P)H-dependent oxidoreductase [Allomuricauda aequoris]TXJ99351.1 NAD(P)H-dependent oxidoreductase [Allomuricauda aequoris]
MNIILEHRTWRYATKKFDPSKKVSDQDLETLLEATRLSASSYGLQPYHIFVISDQETKEKLKPASWNQSQITDASHVIVFANTTDFGEELVDNFIENTSTTRNIPIENLKGYADFMKSKLVSLPSESKDTWTAKQAYIAFGNLMQAAAELKIDTCPMEGFESDQYNEILGLTEKNLNAAVVLTIGYRSEEDQTQHLPKVRKSKEALFTHI